MQQEEWKPAAKPSNCLISNDTKLATGISKEINNFNIERRTVDRIITTEAMRMISEDQRTVNAKNNSSLSILPGKRVLSELWLQGLLKLITGRR